MLQFDEKLILAKVETVYGTDSVPVAGTNDILTRNFRLTPMAGQRRPRLLDRPSLGASAQAVTQIRRQVSFEVELAGAGAAGTAPKYGSLLRACGFDETVDAGVDVEYDPESDSGDSLSIYFNLDGVLHAMLGWRGAVGFSFTAGEYPFLSFNGEGLFVTAADAAQGTPDYSGFVKPLEVNNDNTPTFSLHGYSAVLQNLVVQPGQTVSYRNLVGQEAVRLTGREYSGQARFLMDTVANFDLEAAVSGETLAALQLVHGTAAGGIVQLDAPKVQILDYSIDEDQGDAMVTAQLNFTSTDAGDDELKLTIK